MDKPHTGRTLAVPIQYTTRRPSRGSRRRTGMSSRKGDRRTSRASSGMRKVRSTGDFSRIRAGTAAGKPSGHGHPLPVPTSPSALSMARLSARIRELQYEVGLLNRKMKEKESEAITPMMSARYAVLFNNVLLAGLMFLTGTSAGLRMRAKRKSLRDSLNEAIGAGLLRSSPFVAAFGFLLSNTGWRRNVGFLLSCSSSLYWLVVRRELVVPNSTSILLNVWFLIVRHYYLHGLLSFQWAAHLH